MGSPLESMARHACTARQLARVEYIRGWWWGLVCGATVGVCTTGTGVWLWHLVAEALRCPTC